jgi:formylglycine-generating enzyme required for sulfatase activity
VRVPAGEFLMGSDPAKDKNARKDEQPQHRVYVSEFYIAKYPVTNEQYAVFVRETQDRAPDHWEKGKIPSGKENHPAVHISWDDAVAFCEWLSRASGRAFRLPTEAEWEKAARGIDGRKYPWGNRWAKRKLNSEESGPGDTTLVGRYSPGGDSPYGAVDMAGNVWEWCTDWYDEKEYQSRVKEIVRNPQGPSQGQYRVLRGGSWGDDGHDARCACRNRYFRLYKSYLGGARVAVSPI